MGAGGKRRYIPPTVLEAAGEKRPRTKYHTTELSSASLSASLSAATHAAPALAMTAARSGPGLSRGASSQLLGDASNLRSQLEHMGTLRRQKVRRVLFIPFR